jgi:hypothetical protein
MFSRIQTRRHFGRELSAFLALLIQMQRPAAFWANRLLSDLVHRPADVLRGSSPSVQQL